MQRASIECRASVGCRAHSGWAALVAIAGSPASPQVIDRRRIEIADPSISGSKQPFHAAEPLEFRKAEALLKRCEASTKQMARQALQEAIQDLAGLGYSVASFGIVLGSGRPLPALKSILASHALIHTAEGEFYRNILAETGKDAGLAVAGFKERELFEIGASRLRTSTEHLQRRVAELGKPIGPPWTQDQKFAALVAWLALVG